MVLVKSWLFKQNSNKLMDLLLRKEGYSTPREPPWLRACLARWLFGLNHTVESNHITTWPLRGPLNRPYVYSEKFFAVPICLSRIVPRFLGGLALQHTLSTAKMYASAQQTCERASTKAQPAVLWWNAI